jgi:aspartate/glutamate racemase
MAISCPDMERETYQAAAADGPRDHARMALHTLVKNELEAGTNRQHIVDVLVEVADEYAEQGEGDREGIVLDVIDAMYGGVKPGLRL